MSVSSGHYLSTETSHSSNMKLSPSLRFLPTWTRLRRVTHSAHYDAGGQQQRGRATPKSAGGNRQRRESRVLSLIAQGMTNHEFLHHLQLSPNSVKPYIRKACRKVGVNTRPRAVAWSMQISAIRTWARGKGAKPPISWGRSAASHRSTREVT